MRLADNKTRKFLLKTIRTSLLMLAQLFSLTAFSQINIGTTIIETYKGQCPSVVTRSVQDSLSNIRSMMATLQQLKSQNNCFGTAELEETILRFNQVYQDYQVYNQSGENRHLLNRKIAELTRLSSEENISPEIQMYIENEIYLSQSELISTENTIDRFNTWQSREYKSANSLVTSMESFLSGWGTNPGCFQKKSSLISNLVSNGLLTTASFAMPGTGLALASGGVLIHSINNFLNEYKFNSATRDFDEITMPTAIRCLSQAITSNYCQSDENLKLIDTYLNDMENEEDNLEGIDLLTRHLGQLNTWLREVFAGSAITSEGDLANRERPILQSELLEKVLRYIETYGTIRRQLFNDIQTPREKSEAIAISISNLVQIMQNPSLTPTTGGRNPWGTGSSNTLENPIFISRDKKLLPYQLYDPNLSNIPLCNAAGAERPCSSLLEYTRVKGIALNLNDWNDSLSNSLGVVQEVLNQVNIQRARTVSVDAFSVIVRSNRDLNGETNALEALKKIGSNASRIIEYLSSLDEKKNLRHGLPEPTHKYYPQILNTYKTKKLTETVISLIKEAFTPDELDENKLPKECRKNEKNAEDDIGQIDQKSFRITSCITNILKLAERGNDVYFQKLRDMVGYELDAKFKNGEFEDEVRDIIYSTRRDLVDALVQSYSEATGSMSLSEVYTGLESAKSISFKTYKSTFDFFKKEIIKSLKLELSSGEKADLCFRILPFLYQNKKDKNLIKTALKTCKGVKAKFYKEIEGIRFDDFITTTKSRFLSIKFKFSKIENEKLFCQLDDYYRSNLIFENSQRKKETP